MGLDSVFEALERVQSSLSINTMIVLAYAIINIRKTLNSRYLCKRDRVILRAIINEIEDYLEARLNIDTSDSPQ